MLTRWLGLSALIIVFTAGSAASESLDSLVAEAQKEGGLRAQVIDTAGPEAGKIADAFSKRFGLSNVTVATENESTAFQKAEMSRLLRRETVSVSGPRPTSTFEMYRIVLDGGRCA